MIIFNGRVHWGFALIVWLLIQQGVDDVFLNPIPFLVGSVFPDCDHRNAPMGRILPLWIICNHRGFTHSIIGLVVFSLPIGYYSWKWSALFAAGYLLHLAMDSSTPMGVRWLIGHRKKKAYF